MVQCKSDITNEMISLIQLKQDLPNLDFVTALLKAFVNVSTLDQYNETHHAFNPATITTFLGVYEATKNYTSYVAKITKQASTPSSTIMNEGEKNLMESPAITSSVLPSFPVAPVPSRIEPTFSAAPALAEAAAEETPHDDVRCYNCNEIGAGNKLYQCETDCQLLGCPRIDSLETKGQSSIPPHETKCCPLRRSRENFEAYIS